MPLISHVRVKNFLANVMAHQQGLGDQPVIVHDTSRILDASSSARELELEPGSFMDTVDIPDQVERLEFDLDAIHPFQKEIRQRVIELSPIAESLELGEFLVEVDSSERVRQWHEDLDHDPLSLTVAVAPSGWLARILTDRLDPGDYRAVDADQYEDVLQSVAVSEFWGLGNDIISSLKEGDLQSMAEIYHLEESDRRRLLGKGSGVFKRLFEASDPRPISAFSRPQSLSRELYLEEEEIETEQQLKKRATTVLKRFQEHLRSSASMAYRMTVTFFRPLKNEEFSHDFTTPTDEVDVFQVALDRILKDVDDLDGLKITLDVIVGDVDNYHATTQEDANDLEILS